MSGVVRILISDSKNIETSAIQVITSGRVLMNLGSPNEAVIVLRFLLQLSSPMIFAERIIATSMLYELGQVELATSVIRLFINDDSLTADLPHFAIRTFYSMNPDEHREEARELMAHLCVDSKEIKTIEEARSSAREIFSTSEERVASRLIEHQARIEKMKENIRDREEAVRMVEQIMSHKANILD